VLPAVRVPRKLWLYFEEIMKREMFSSKAELIKDTLREYVIFHKELIKDFDIISISIELKEDLKVIDEIEKG